MSNKLHNNAPLLKAFVTRNIKDYERDEAFVEKLKLMEPEAIEITDFTNKGELATATLQSDDPSFFGKLQKWTMARAENSIPREKMFTVPNKEDLDLRTVPGLYYISNRVRYWVLGCVYVGEDPAAYVGKMLRENSLYDLSEEHCSLHPTDQNIVIINSKTIFGYVSMVPAPGVVKLASKDYGDLNLYL